MSPQQFSHRRLFWQHLIGWKWQRAPSFFRIPAPFQTVELWVFSFLACTFCGDISCREVQIIWGSQCDSRKHLPWGPHTPGDLWSLHEVIRVCCCAFFQVSVASDPGRRGQHNMLSPFHSPFQSPFRSPMRSPFRSPFKNFGHPGGRTIDFDCEDDDMNLNCFILMFDLLLKQVVEPEIPLVPRLGPVLVILSVGWGSLLSLTRATSDSMRTS